MSSGSGAVFFDRDGTLNRPAIPGEYIRHGDDLELLPGAASAVSRVNAVGVPAILVTNQRWLSTPGASFGAYRQIEVELARLLAVEGAKLNATYTCPHALDVCMCRKPLPGLLLKAAEELDVNLTASYLIGDSASDVQAGLAVGATTILITQQPDSNAARLAHHVAASVLEAADLVLAAIVVSQDCR
jgi:D-glycero-D-manno-heptose 1,7-bisphosphate phosphatase